MCGIAGIVQFNKEPVSHRKLKSMNSQMVHRGPDGEGYYVDQHIGLAHLRLAIIDLATGDQPMSSLDQQVTVVFNGEIYNFHDVRKELQAKGFQFRTTSDTEVLIHGWRAWGTQMLSRLNGMFAFAIYDRKARQLFIARDRFGVKPLYYFLDKDSLIFASELGGLMASQAVPVEIDPSALDLYLHYQYIPAPLTIYREVKKLSPAEYLLINVDTGKNERQTYWDIAVTKSPNHKRTLADWMEELDELLNDAVRIRLISDVAFGAFLSGGADSGIVVAMMASKLSMPVKTFSIGLEDQKDELPYARQVAQKFNTDHEELKISPEGLTIIPKLCPHFGEPFADSSAVPTYYVSKLASAKVKMVLTGDGGDEMFAGYQRYSYIADALNSGRAYASSLPAIPAPTWKLAARRLRALVPEAFPFAKRIAKQANIQLPSVSTDAISWTTVYDIAMSHFSLSERKELQKDTNNFSDADYFLRQYPYPAADSIVGQAQFCDVKSYLPGDILTKVDRMSMANSLETRSPLLDYRLAELAYSMPIEVKLPEPLLDGSKNKYILKELASKYLGRDYVYRPKEGFGIPVSQWLREDKAGYLKDCLLDEKSLVYNYLEKAPCKKMISDHLAGNTDYGYKLWNLLMLDGWLRYTYMNYRSKD